MSAKCSRKALREAKSSENLSAGNILV
jgi:hypothetical protein